ncbi:MAG: CotH kinase family protein [Clostridia bacterium]|nr:CotH kinase family protein [Clostridia bacterium]
MAAHKHIDKICSIAAALSLLLTVLFMNGAWLGIIPTERVMGYENRLFDTTRVHTVDIVMEDWDSFIESCENEEYALCSMVIDGEAYENIGIRAKGNTSLSNVSSMNSDRYSFKVEFDQYDSTKSYHGLDKLSLNNLIQDNSFLKDYLVYEMMRLAGAAAPLASFAYITVNGADWGLYLALEGVEDAFLQRNYGNDHGELYKPDSMSFGGGRGNGKNFNMDDFAAENQDGEAVQDEASGAVQMPGQMPFGEKGGFGGRGSRGEVAFAIDEEALCEALEAQGIDPSVLDGIDFENMTAETLRQLAEQLEGIDWESLMKAAAQSNAAAMPSMQGGRGGMGGMGSSDVKLQYIDDDPQSYSNIFDNAKTDITDADKARLIGALKTLGSGENKADAVDVEAVLRYFAVHNFVVNGDSYTGSMIHNYYLYEKDGVLSMIPWNYNLAFGTFQGNRAADAVNDPIDSPVSGGSMEDRPMVSWIFETEAYTALYHEYLSQFICDVFDSGVFAQTVDSVSTLIAPYVEKDPTKFCTYEEFEAGVAAIKAFCLLRAESVKGQLQGTIPSTAEGQAADSSTLIDIGSLDLSDLGTMGNGMGGGKGGFAAAPDAAENEMPFSGSMTVPDIPTAPEGLVLPGGAAMPGGFPGGMMPGNVPPEGTNGFTAPFAGELPAQTEQNGGMPQMPVPNMETGEGSFLRAEAVSGGGTSSALMLGISIAVLAGGIVFAFCFKRRKG